MNTRGKERSTGEGNHGLGMGGIFVYIVPSMPQADIHMGALYLSLLPCLSTSLFFKKTFIRFQLDICTKVNDQYWMWTANDGSFSACEWAERVAKAGLQHVEVCIHVCMHVCMYVCMYELTLIQ